MTEEFREHLEYTFRCWLEDHESVYTERWQNLTLEERKTLSAYYWQEFRKDLDVEPSAQLPKDKIFSGEHSRLMWNEINGAQTVDSLRGALYTVCCRLQEMESLLRKRPEQDKQPDNA